MEIVVLLKYAMVPVSILLSILIYPRITDWTYSWWGHSLKIIPKKIGLMQNAEVTSVIKVINNNNYPIYQATLLTTIEKGKIDSSLIKITQTSSKPTTHADAIHMGLEGKNDKGFLVITRTFDMDPNSATSFSVEFPKNTSREKGWVKFKIVGYQKEPPKTFRLKGLTAVPEKLDLR